MSQIGEHVSIRATNAGAIIDALTDQLREAQGMKDYYCGQVVTLTAETEAQAAEIKLLKEELEKGKQVAPAHKFNVGDRVQAHGGLVGIIQAIDAAFSNFPYLVKWHGGKETWAGINSLSPAPDSPDAALS